jgi:hypothetical protein
MRIVIEIDGNQVSAGTTQSASTVAGTSMPATATGHAAESAAVTAAGGGGTDAGPGPDFAMTGSNMPFIPMPSAMSGTEESTVTAAVSDLSAGAGPGATQEVTVPVEFVGTEGEQ